MRVGASVGGLVGCAATAGAGVFVLPPAVGCTGTREGSAKVGGSSLACGAGVPQAATSNKQNMATETRIKRIPGFL
jgi:hypothetical protein